MTESEKNLEFQDEINLLDLLQVVVENLRLLVLAPLFAGIFVFVAATLWPKTYESTAILRTEDAGLVTRILSQEALQSLAKAPYLKTNDGEGLKNKIRVTFSAKDKTITLSAKGSTPEAARTLAHALLQEAFKQSQPYGTVKATLNKQFAQAQQREKDAAQTATVIQKSIIDSGNNASKELALSYDALIRVIADAQEKQVQIEGQLRGLDDSQLLQAPSTPIKPISPKRVLLTVMAVLGFGFLLLIWVFIRNGLNNLKTNEAGMQQWNAIREGFFRAVGVRSNK